jgi:DNA-binding GntR family transcriptional regulator
MAVKLNTYIKEDLQGRIETAHGIPEPLTLANLSKHYGVSFTPVRAAVEELIQEGLINKHLHNGRLEINKRKVGTCVKRKVVPCPLTPESWDRILIKDVMLASLGRRSTYLREEALTQKYKVGRSVIRQTFSRFAGAGLIKHVSRCGWLVHPLHEQDVQAYLVVRELLERKAMDLAKPHLVREDLERMLIINRTAEKQGTLRLDNHLHEYLIDKAGNRYIRDFFHQQVPIYYSALCNYAAPETSVVKEMAAQHCQILESLIARAWDRAEQALAKHIQSQACILRKLLVLARDESEDARR